MATRKPWDPPKKKVGRPPKILARRDPSLREIDAVPGVHGAPLTDKEIGEVKVTLAATRIKPDADCPICAKSESAIYKINKALVTITASGVTSDGDKSIKELAKRWNVDEEALIRHRDLCMKRDAVMVLEKKGTGDIENSAAWIGKLTKYLEVVDGVIMREEMQPEPDPRVLVGAADEGRKICETNAKLFLDLWRLRVDAKVQDDFMRIVLEVVNQIAPAAKERIVERIKARLAMATAGGARSWLQ